MLFDYCTVYLGLYSSFGTKASMEKPRLQAVGVCLDYSNRGQPLQECSKMVVFHSSEEGTH